MGDSSNFKTSSSLASVLGLSPSDAVVVVVVRGSVAESSAKALASPEQFRQLHRLTVTVSGIDFRCNADAALSNTIYAVTYHHSASE